VITIEFLELFMTVDAIIIGAGLAGLSCARHLHRSGRRVIVVESADAVGGRVRTDIVDGFQLDRGFQVFIHSYPEARRVLDIPALKLLPFLPGALIRKDGAFYELADPFRRPWAGFKSLFTPIGTMRDKLRIASFRSTCLEGSPEKVWQSPETTALLALQEAGFSAAMIDSFFRPFLGGIFLDRELQTSSRMLRFVFRMFSTGLAALPAAGMQAIPKQLAAAIPAESIRLNTRVVGVTEDGVSLADGSRLEARSIVVATELSAAARLLGDPAPAAGCGTTCLYFSTERPPVTHPILVLNGDGRGPINSLCVPTAVAPTYGPGGRSLVSISVIGTRPDADILLAEVRAQLREWYGPAVSDWKHLRTDVIPFALPSQAAPALQIPERDVRRRPGLYVCGDHVDQASINGAMVSGRRAAEALLEDSRD
jgi:phytoene dehydrogenase-like protein